MKLDEFIDLFGQLMEWVCRLAFVLVALLVLFAPIKLFAIDSYNFRKDTGVLNIVFFYMLFYLVPTYYLGRLMIQNIKNGGYSATFTVFSIVYIIWGLMLLLGIDMLGLYPGWAR